MVIKKLREHRISAEQTQKGLATKMGMSHRTITDTKLRRSSPKFETVALLAKELNISLMLLLFPDTSSPNVVPKCVLDFFEGMSDSEANNYIEVCKTVGKLNKHK